MVADMRHQVIAGIVERAIPKNSYVEKWDVAFLGEECRSRAPDPALLGAGSEEGGGAPAGTVRNAPSPGVAINPNDPATWGKVARNARCPCGSGKEYKHCHGAVG